MQAGTGFDPWKKESNKKRVKINNMNIDEVQELLVTAARKKVEIRNDKIIEEDWMEKALPTKIDGKKRDLKSEFRKYLKSVIFQ